MFVLRLSDIRNADENELESVCRAETREALDAHLRAEHVTGYYDGVWFKSFKKDGPLEWYRPPCSEHANIVDAGSEENWVERTRREYAERVMSLPCK